MIRSLLIANRGEIACRIIRTARSMGIRTIAVHSEADAGAMHVREADEAVAIGPPPAAESYLQGDRIIAAAKATGAEAIHPGYGFLSENAGFAQAVIDAGLIWVGPPPAAITAMGLKDAAKALMQAAGVPVTPGYLGEDQSPERLFSEAQAIGWPVLIKAVAGGGGKGMRRVDASEDFAEALLSCRREAQASFGNDAVILEKWITSPRHIEVQVFGDSHGNVVHLFERDCSLQRRHQKVIEEAPAPGMDEETRAAICAAAVRAAKAVDYVGAGTVEFIADASQGALSADRIWFMEMNTRLQVEHPVTEEITGVDLVEWQLRVASGEPLPLAQEDLSINGWAMEARLYAEDPARGFLPSTGLLELASFADGYGIRVETGVEDGDEISPFYDPMIAKLVAHGDTREEAIATLAEQLATSVVWPVKTNAAFLLACLRDTGFAEGGVTTGHIAEHVDTLTLPPSPQEADWQAAAQQLWLQSMPAQSNTLPGPWTALDGFRANGPRRLFVTLQQGAHHRQIDLSAIDVADDHPYLIPVSDGLIALRDGQPLLFQTPRNTGSSSGSDAASGAITAPMPGRVIAVAVAAGDSVLKGQKLLTLEAMKMEHSLTAPFDGVVAELSAIEGQQVQVDALLIRIEQRAEALAD
ncbi:ATP-grasp domain-containing protein [Altererythrobacter xixiisoli]|uniref:ATP-grasp domain-containing protein n=1 Tax=Croceibacterium xixiisoli TaxID=1476466 RepID=A0A6I4U1F9_9SPHN|nr:acetyl/propionyl/methylcrotonyl-CoA carboxylase subunit alpha [Croceibacterium xixiisoli]MXP00504.1 ATP-grasp domain-containing protein [Croceibacterium xixiisoli]